VDYKYLGFMYLEFMYPYKSAMEISCDMLTYARTPINPGQLAMGIARVMLHDGYFEIKTRSTAEGHTKVVDYAPPSSGDDETWYEAMIGELKLAMGFADRERQAETRRHDRGMVCTCGEHDGGIYCPISEPPITKFGPPSEEEEQQLLKELEDLR
jgi:hypothetical protein